MMAVGYASLAWRIVFVVYHLIVGHHMLPTPKVIFGEVLPITLSSKNVGFREALFYVKSEILFGGSF